MNVFIILGNGFSMDLINHLKINGLVNLGNLFYNGEKVKWPVDNKCGFLSYQYCPSLWRLGARPTNSANESNKLINDILTCINVYASLDVKRRQQSSREKDSTYIKAYNELVVYLRSLFIYYDNIFKQTDLDKITDWEWIKLFSKLNNNPKITKVNIVTYNYDIFLERVLDKIGIQYSVFLGTESDKKFNIFKPHGSISFIHKQQMDIDAFSIKSTFDHIDVNLTDFHVQQDNLICNPLVIPLIPPSGQSSRYKNTWADTIREKITNICNESHPNDILIAGGISYCYVDRDEIDQIIINMNDHIEVILINPNQTEDFFAVVTTLFSKVRHFPNILDFSGEHSE